MNLLKRLMGGSRADATASDERSFADDIREMTASEDAAARADDNSGLVAIYPELGASRRRRRRGFADIDFDEYVPELDDYEPGQSGKYLGDDGAEAGPADPLSRTLEELRRDPPAPTGPAEVEDETDPVADIAAEPVADDGDGDEPEMADEPPAAAAPERERSAERRVPRDVPSDRVKTQPLVRTDDDEAPAERRRPAALVEVPQPATGRSGGRRAGRVKTRLLGFDSASTGTDPFEAARQSASTQGARYPVGWIIVMKGPGRGASFTLLNGVSPVGRGEDQAVKLDFGDMTISRSNHAMVAYDAEQRKFFLGHGGKANLVRLNGKPVLSTEELNSNDEIRIGETTLRFIALCGPEFDWTQDGEADEADAAIA